MSGKVLLLRPVSAAKRRRAELDAEARALFAWARRVQRLTVEQCAARCGVSRDAVERWLTGKRRVPGAALVAMGVVLEGRRLAA